jgi:two-component system, cell cycle sensor histidine kinase and response regulator CckA
MRESESARKGDETILVVDDELACLELTQAMLHRYGYSVITAQSGLQALHLLRDSPDTHVDLAIIDIVMHDMTGLEVAKEIRVAWPALPILFVSSYSQDPTLRPPSTRDVPFLAKPFTSITLTEKIRELLAPKAASAGDLA